MWLLNVLNSNPKMTEMLKIIANQEKKLTLDFAEEMQKNNILADVKEFINDDWFIMWTSQSVFENKNFIAFHLNYIKNIEFIGSSKLGLLALSVTFIDLEFIM